MFILFKFVSMSHLETILDSRSQLEINSRVKNSAHNLELAREIYFLFLCSCQLAKCINIQYIWIREVQKSLELNILSLVFK